MEKDKHSKVMGFLNILGEAEIYTILKTWEKTMDSHSTGTRKVWKNTNISNLWVS